VQDKLIFVVGSPRSGSTLLMRMMSSHSQIYGRPEPHLLTPLAHLGFYDRVDRAPYDQLQAAQATRGFVSELPGGEEDYLDACRAYCHTLYGRMLSTQQKPYFLDKTPAYALVLPFLEKVFPKAHFVVLTRNPCSIWDSYAESFFDGDYSAALAFNPIPSRYVPAMADFLRKASVPRVHVRYEDLVVDPETQLARIYAHIGIPNEPQTVNYGAAESSSGGLGDPIGVAQHKRPVTSSLDKWANSVAIDGEKEGILRGLIDGLDPRDLEAWGYDKASLFAPLAEVDRDAALKKAGEKRKRDRWKRYKLQRRVLIWLRRNIHRNAFGRLVRKIRFLCDVLLRGVGQTGWTEETLRGYGERLESKD
jgi:hypothetical protein